MAEVVKAITDMKEDLRDVKMNNLELRNRVIELELAVEKGTSITH